MALEEEKENFEGNILVSSSINNYGSPSSAKSNKELKFSLTPGSKEKDHQIPRFFVSNHFSALQREKAVKQLSEGVTEADFQLLANKLTDSVDSNGFLNYESFLEIKYLFQQNTFGKIFTAELFLELNKIIRNKG